MVTAAQTTQTQSVTIATTAQTTQTQSAITTGAVPPSSISQAALGLLFAESLHVVESNRKAMTNPAMKYISERCIQRSPRLIR